MEKYRVRDARVCFGLLLVVGLGLCMFGVVGEPILSAVQLDAVLTPAEYADPDTREATRALLERARGNRWLEWLLAGVVVAALSGVGLHATRGAA